MQLGPRNFAASTAKSLETYPHPRLGDDPETWQVPALDSSRLLINAEERVGGGVVAHPS